MIAWIMESKTINEDGTTIVYRGIDEDMANTSLRIESRKRHIQRANRAGTWDHTSYHVIMNGMELVQKSTLTAAKEYAEQIRKCK